MSSSGTAYKIDDNIPLPDSARGRGAKGNGKYPFGRMEVGQSVFIAGLKQSSVFAATRNATNSRGFKFTTRKVTEDGVAGVRVWRVA